MELVPPVGWADVATKRDVDSLGGRLDRFDVRMDRLEGRMDDFDQHMSSGFDRMHRDLRLQLYWLLGFFATMTGIVTAVVA